MSIPDDRRRARRHNARFDARLRADLSLLDMKAEADRHFLMGINQLIGHGWPYTAAGVDYPGWRFYAAAVFDEHSSARARPLD